MTTVNALTHYGKGKENSIITPAVVMDDTETTSIQTKGIWDTGATNSCITADLAAKLGLKPVSMATVVGVHGSQVVNVYIVKIRLNNQNIELACRVTEVKGLAATDTGLLIGMDVITLGDFSISNYKGQTVMSFRVPSLQQIDYVAEINENNRIAKIHQAQAKHGNEKCPCGSGKLYKNCHGKSIYNK